MTRKTITCSVSSAGRSRFVTAFGVLVALALVVLWPLGCVSTTTPGAGSLAGTVVNDAGQAVSGVSIQTPTTSTLTDLDGRWQINDLPAGPLTVSATRSGYEPLSRSVEVRSGYTIDGVNFQMAAGGSLANLSATGITAASATIRFTTRVPTVSWVDYGTNNLYGQRTSVLAASVTTHVHTLTGLNPSTTYHWRASAWDRVGRQVTSTDQVFTTSQTRRSESPTGLVVANDANTSVAVVTWDTDTQGDLAGYRVYRSASPYGPFDLISGANLVPASRYLDSTINPGEKGYYRVTRISGSGEESPPSSMVGFVLAGQTRGNVVWTSDMNPIELGGDLIIAQNTSLTVGPGVQVRVADTNARILATGTNGRIAVIVQGSLSIEGFAGAEVTFTSAALAPQAGDWHGIRFEANSNVAASRCRSLDLAFARRGIDGVSGLPTVTDSVIRSCAETGVNTTIPSVAFAVRNTTVAGCLTGIAITGSTAPAFDVSSNTVYNCGSGIVARNNRLSRVQGNVVRYWQTAGIDVGNINGSSVVTQNVVGPGGNGSAVIARGYDEIRRNTLQGHVGIEIRDYAQTTLRSNLILANSEKADVGVLYRGSDVYAVASHTIQNNDIWNIGLAGARYIDATGAPLAGIHADVRVDPTLLGGDPFVEPQSSTFDYHPAPRSPLKAQGYAGEDIGAFTVP